MKRTHLITKRHSPIAVIITCECGWHLSISRRQNALARASKERAAIKRHLVQIAIEQASHIADLL